MSDKSLRHYITLIENKENVYRIKLPVSFNDVKDTFSEEQLNLHYNVLHKKYVEKVEDWGDFAIAGVELHNLYFSQFKKHQPRNLPHGPSKELIEDNFGSFYLFKEEVNNIAIDFQGSGWIYLDTNGYLKTIKNHQRRENIALIIDLWEHAYIIDYGSDKKEYINNLWKVIDWNIINARIG